MKYGELTSDALYRAARDTIAVLPLAAVEQHGSHLPVITDTAIADELGRRVEQAMPKRVVLLPTLWCGSSHHHKGFPGALSLRSDTYVQVLCDLADCLIETGFRRIFLLNCHGGNQTPFAEALYRLNQKHRGPREPWIAASSYWNLAVNELERQKFMATPKLSHACEYETSLMMALRLDWVSKPSRRKIPPGVQSKYYDPLNYEPSRVVVSQSFDQLTPTGALGSPELATAEKGELLYRLLTTALTDFLAEFSQWKQRKT
jgi:creatinine amidohydrolase